MPARVSATIDGGAGSDTLRGGEGDDTIYAGDDHVPDTLEGGGGDDVLYGVNISHPRHDSGAARMSGGAGDDLLVGGQPCDGDLFDGGPGDNDSASFARVRNSGVFVQATIGGPVLDPDVAGCNAGHIEDSAEKAVTKRVATRTSRAAVVAGPPEQQVWSAPAAQHVGATSAEEPVSARACEHSVGPGARFDHVVAPSSADQIPSAERANPIVAGAGKDHIVRRRSRQHVGSGSADDRRPLTAACGRRGFDDPGCRGRRVVLRIRVFQAAGHRGGVGDRARLLRGENANRDRDRGGVEAGTPLLASVLSAQVSAWPFFLPLALQLPCVEAADTKLAPLGRLSVTTTLVAASGPALATWIE